MLPEIVDNMNCNNFSWLFLNLRLQVNAGQIS